MQMRVALDKGFVRPRVVLAAFRALVYAAGERVCRSVQSAVAVRALKELGGVMTTVDQQCDERTKGWSRASKGLAEVSFIPFCYGWMEYLLEC